MKRFAYMAVCITCMLTAFFFYGCNGNTHTHRWKLCEEIVATCEKSGGDIYECDCGAKKTEPIEAKGHDWKETERTETSVYLICQRCNASSETLFPGIIDSSSGERDSSETVDSSSGEENSSETVDSSSSERDSSETVDSSSSERDSSETVDSSSSERDSSETVDGSFGEDPFDKNEAEKVRFYFKQTQDGSGYVCMGLEYDEQRETLRLLVIPDSYLGKPVTEIAASAFANFPALNCVYLGKNLQKLGAQSFFNCYNLVEIHNYYGLNLEMDPYAITEYSNILDHALAVYETPTESKISCDAEGYVTYSADGVKQLIGYAGKETELVLPTDLTGINRNIFSRIEQLKSVVIGDKVTKIGTYVFADCVTLEEITFGEGLRRIELRAFQNCVALQHAYFAQSYGWGLENGMVFTEAEITKTWIVASYLHSEFYEKTWVWYGEIYGI